MNPLQSAIPVQHYTGSISTRQPQAATSLQTQQPHPAALSLASLSANAHSALDQTEAQPNGHHKLMAMLARNGIADGAMHLNSTQGADAHYKQQVNVLPENNVAYLTVRARLNAQAQYDIAGIDLHVPSSGKTESIALSASPPVQHSEDDTMMGAQTPSMSSHLGALGSRGQFAQALIRQNSNPEFSSAPQPSGASESAKRRRATEAQIDAHLRKADGSFRTQKEIGSDLRAAGLTAGNSLIQDRLQAAGGAQNLPGAMEAQIDAHLRKADGSLRTRDEVRDILRAAGLGASSGRIAARLSNAAGGARRQPGATVAEIDAHLRHANGKLRDPDKVRDALNADGLGADTRRIIARLQVARRKP